MEERHVFSNSGSTTNIKTEIKRNIYLSIHIVHVVGWMVAPQKDILISGTCEFGENVFADVIKLRISRGDI